MKRTQLILILCFLTICTALSGQGWERTFGGSDLDIGGDVLQTSNGDIIGVGRSASFDNAAETSLYLVRTDTDGNTIWEHTYPITDTRIFGQSITSVSDGNYLATGYLRYADESEDVFLTKINPDGEEIWTSIIEAPGKDRGFQAIESSDGGFAIVGWTEDIISAQRDIYLLKTDANGNQQWSKKIGQSLFDTGFSLIQNINGEYIIAGYKETMPSPTDTIREAVLEIRSTFGEPVDIFTLGEAPISSGADVLLNDDGSYTTAFYNIDTTVSLIKVSNTGIIEWSEVIADLDIFNSSSLVKTPDGGFTLTGSVLEDNVRNLKIVKTDNQGNIEWARTHGGLTNNDEGLAICNTQGEGFGLIGYTRSFGAGSFDMYLLKTDSLGNTLNNFITGNVFYDLDESCDLDPGEYGLNDWLIEAVGNTKTYYGLSNEDGNYEIAVEEGDYTLNLILLNAYWQNCENNIPISLSGSYDTTVVDFPLQSLIDCPYMEVDISTPFLRRCFENRYTVSYCNQGTISAENVEIEVVLDEYFTFLDATNSNYTIDGNTYTFDIGNVGVNECNTFYIDVLLDCDSTLLGQTHCVEASITPDSICTPPLACWDGGSVELDANCEGDSVRFTVKNVGTANVAQSLEYIVIEDHVILFQRPIDQDIEPDSSIFILQAVAGQTIRIEVDQPPCHPGNSTPTVTVEGCGEVDDEDISLGYLTQYYEDDSNPNISVDCQENIGSWDPNDKRGFPKGYEDQHYIEANTELDYHIRFQNTGSDTAFRVVIRDTLSEWLDIRDVQAGSSSHSYDLEIYGSNILKFTFLNIDLPDSTTNEIASHGFVKFRIAQQLDNPEGTIIKNSAAIYFDYNEPVITNETFHTIGENYIEILSYDDIFTPGVHVKYYPNPFDQETTFEISYDNEYVIPDFETKTFHLFDVQGREIRQEQFDGNKFQFQRNGLATGLYFFEIEAKNKLIIGGKLIAH